MVRDPRSVLQHLPVGVAGGEDLGVLARAGDRRPGPAGAADGGAANGRRPSVRISRYVPAPVFVRGSPSRCRPAKSVALVGTTGAGKTTINQADRALLHPGSGSVVTSTASTCVTCAARSPPRRHGPGELPVRRDRSPTTASARSARRHRCRVRAAAATWAPAAFITACRNHRRRAAGGRLSAGQRQLLASPASLLDPAVLILDEGDITGRPAALVQRAAPSLASRTALIMPIGWLDGATPTGAGARTRAGDGDGAPQDLIGGRGACGAAPGLDQIVVGVGGLVRCQPSAGHAGVLAAILAAAFEIRIGLASVVSSAWTPSSAALVTGRSPCGRGRSSGSRCLPAPATDTGIRYP